MILRKSAGWITALLFAVFVPASVGAQTRTTGYPDSLFPPYYHQRVSHFESLPITDGAILFAGNSLTDGAEWSDLFRDQRIINQGISGDIITGLIHRIESIARHNPRKIFVMIGINDLARGASADSLLLRLQDLISRIRKRLPNAKLYVQSLLPVNERFGKFPGHTGRHADILRVNAGLRKLAMSIDFAYVPLHEAFSDANGRLLTSLTNDGLHLNGAGYQLWKHLLYPFVYDAQPDPAILPAPRELEWSDERFPLYRCKAIYVTEPALMPLAQQLIKHAQAMGLQLRLTGTRTESEPYIELHLTPNQRQSKGVEAYQLTVDNRVAVVQAATPHGIFNGMQTLRQLMRDGAMIRGCRINDWPAFGWRAYMIDVGRNYVSMDLLKQQIDMMALYKLNVFHFHPTEDIAWRWQIDKYPQLTAPETMLRNKGMYYSSEEILELIAYCNERFITFVPEIDMPGHSAAFRRAMQTDMQTPEGLEIVKDILREVCETYPVPYIHIGADEVTITNEAFIPEVTRLIESYGRQVIGWQPGGNFLPGTIRQWWMDDNAHISQGTSVRMIDSRHLYLNHMDPLESVTMLFNRQLCDRPEGDSLALGATLCLWHDRAVATEADLLRMNPVYPAMLAFAERTWRGGGTRGWIANTDDGDFPAFVEFENRLLDHRQQYFAGLPFPYARQANLSWRLYGPFTAYGTTPVKPEIYQTPDTALFQNAPYQTVRGGSITLRHWWAPLIKGAIGEPAENTVVYATATMRSESDTVRNFWIGFGEPSRSTATDSYPAGAWDNRGSRLYVNGRTIAAPAWRRAGQRGHSEIPLTDEGYAYRAPTRIALRRGDNHILLVLPVQGFRGRDWQNPVKWMFTFAPAPEL